MLGLKSLGPTEELAPKPPDLSASGAYGTHGVAVECVDIVRNAGGESDTLGCY